jgi:hypothetical protein
MHLQQLRGAVPWPVLNGGFDPNGDFGSGTDFASCSDCGDGAGATDSG